MNYKYRITTILAVVSWQELIKAVFPAYDGQLAEFNGSNLLHVTFDSEQTPADLGPLVKVERVTDLSTLP